MANEELQLRGGTATSPAPSGVATYVIGYMNTGVMPVEVFRQQILAGGQESVPAAPARQADRAAFGTHLREAIDVLRPRR
jgi:hypothetical protein